MAHQDVARRQALGPRYQHVVFLQRRYELVAGDAVKVGGLMDAEADDRQGQRTQRLAIGSLQKETHPVAGSQRSTMAKTI